MTGRKKEFTLTELLGVVGIAGILMIILLPSLTRAQEKSGQEICESNMKQIGQALQMYAQDWDGWINPAYLDGYYLRRIPPYLDDSKGTWNYGWVNAPKSAKIFECPSGKTEIRSPSDPINYMYNGCLGMDTTTFGFLEPKKIGSVKHPFVVLFDGRVKSNGGDFLYFLINDCQYAEGTQIERSVDMRHSGGANFLWLDGHVSWHNKEQASSFPRNYFWEPK